MQSVCNLNVTLLEPRHRLMQLECFFFVVVVFLPSAPIAKICFGLDEHETALINKNNGVNYYMYFKKVLLLVTQ